MRKGKFISIACFLIFGYLSVDKIWNIVNKGGIYRFLDIASAVCFIVAAALFLVGILRNKNTKK